jgi:hypothetical protein
VPSVGMFAYPWDILDCGTPEFLDRCDDLGITELHVTTCYHSGKFLLPKNRRHRVYFPESGRLYVELPGFANEIRPAVSDLAATRWLEDLAFRAAGRGVSLAAWTVFFHGTELAARHPHLVVRNLFGDAYPFALCPSNAEVREYAVGLCRALRSLGFFRSIDLESIGYLGYFHGYHHEVTAVPAGPLEKFLLSLCFCPACQSAAEALGVTVAPMKKRLQEIVVAKVNADDACRASPDNVEQLAALVAQFPDLQIFLRMRFATIRQLICRLRSEVVDTALAVCTSSFAGSPSNIWMEGVHMAELRDLIEAYLLLAYSPESDTVNSDLLFCLAQAGSPSKLHLTLNLGLPVTTSLGNAAEKVEYALKRGVTKFSFFNYGFLGEGRLGWIRELSTLIRQRYKDGIENAVV